MDDHPAFKIMEAAFRSYVEDGTIEIANKSPEDIIDNYKMVVAELVDNEAEIRPIFDHREKLLLRARTESSTGDPEIAVIFYALWVEHSVNGCLISAMERKGYDHKYIDVLIRDSRLKTKLTALWHIAGFRPISDDHVRLMERIAEVRNSFVHYKWHAHDDATHDMLKSNATRLNERALELESVFDSATNELHWNNREEEIIRHYRADVAETIREFGLPPMMQQQPPIDPAPPPPSS